MWPFTRRRDSDFDREIEAHIAIETEQLIADGVSPEEARAAARRRFGNVTAARERFHESNRAPWLEPLLQDVRVAIRSSLRDRGVVLIALLSLALGIGATTAIVSTVDAVLLRPLPYRQPDRLVMVWEDASFAGFPKNTPAPGNYIDWQARNRVFEDMAATRPARANLTGGGLPSACSAAASPPASSACSVCSRCSGARSPRTKTGRMPPSSSSATRSGSVATRAIPQSSGGS